MDHAHPIMVGDTPSTPRGGRQRPGGQKVKKVAKIYASPLFDLKKRDFDL